MRKNIVKFNIPLRSTVDTSIEVGDRFIWHDAKYEVDSTTKGVIFLHAVTPSKAPKKNIILNRESMRDGLENDRIVRVKRAASINVEFDKQFGDNNNGLCCSS